MVFEYAVVLTGGIATGKSTVAKIFEDFGFVIIDADRIAHQVLDDNYLEIEKLFGSKYIKEDLRVDRKALGGLIFSNPIEKKRLEELVHPLIYKEIERLSTEQDIYQKPYIVDIPLFFETNRYPIQKSIVVYTTPKIQLERLIDRDGCTPKEAQQRVGSQLSIETKKLKATYLIDNSRDLKSLQDECDRVKEEILNDF
ncbi:MAG: dephospho-CoA kinase [Epsilonproteobacteria bacterium]|nr:dephospho-CoA kinase [Campylobacterota bacterium]